MRRNLITVSILGGCVLLALNLMVFVGNLRLPVASGQAVGDAPGDVIIATGMTSSGNEAVVYVYSKANETLACYTTHAKGVELKGVRNLRWDLMVPEELIPTGGPITVAQVKKAVGK